MIKLGKIVFALAAVGSIALVACGGSSNNNTVDAAGSDTGSATVETVACSSGSAAATVTAATFAYTSMPAGSDSSDSAIKVGDIVEFDLTTAQDHPVGPDSADGMTDPGLVAPTGDVTCLKFTEVGTFHYKCTVHGFTGTVTVSAD